MTDRELMQQALKALYNMVEDGDITDKQQAMATITALRERLAQPEQEPNYWLGYGLQAHTEKPFEGATPLYTSPPQRKPLTDEEIKLVMDGRGEEGDDDYVKPAFDPFGISEEDLMNFARAIESAHGIKEKT